MCVDNHLSWQWMHALVKSHKPWEAIAVFDRMLANQYVPQWHDAVYRCQLLSCDPS